MYYEEKIIDGLLMCRHSPDGTWVPAHSSRVNGALAESASEVARLRAENERLRKAVAHLVGNDLMNGADWPDDILDFAREHVDVEAGTPIDVLRSALSPAPEADDDE